MVKQAIYISELDKYFFLPIPLPGCFCCGIWLNDPTTGITYDNYSNVINVSRLDDGLECTCDMPFNIDVNCTDMNAKHSNGLPYTARARNDLEVGCTIASGKTSTFIAENKITSKPGFHAAAGSYAHAFIRACPGIYKTSL